MSDALARVTAGFVSPAIRDTQMNGVNVHVGDTIGIIGKEIIVSDKDRITATCALAAAMLALPDKFMLTVFCGADADAAERQELEAKLREQNPDAEIYFIDGGQEIFPYLLATE
jgi:dihydroxyacetone kinase-like predicted kinase